MYVDDVTDAAARLLADAYTAHAPACRLYARSLTPEADDAAHEAFVRLARRLAAGESMPDVPRAWLLTAVRSAALDARRKSRRRQAREVAAFGAEPPLRLFEAGDALDAQTAETALMRLPARQREAVILRLWGELGFEAIAQVTGVTTSTAQPDYVSAIRQLQLHLGEGTDDER